MVSMQREAPPRFPQAGFISAPVKGKYFQVVTDAIVKNHYMPLKKYVSRVKVQSHMANDFFFFFFWDEGPMGLTRNIKSFTFWIPVQGPVNSLGLKKSNLGSSKLKKTRSR